MDMTAPGEVVSMAGADPSIGWGTYIVALALIVAGSFLVTYLSTDLGRLPRAPYIGLLTVVVGAITWAYLCTTACPRRWRKL
jgi:ABC-type uncharacterized transport system permease subunit